MSLLTLYRKLQRKYLKWSELEREKGSTDSDVQDAIRQLLGLDADETNQRNESSHAPAPASTTNSFVNLPLIHTLIQQNSVFSRNEQLDDINTGDLKFLLAHYYHGKLLLSLITNNNSNNNNNNNNNDNNQDQTQNDRLTNLRRARTHLSVFVGRCKQLELVTDADIEALERLKSGMGAREKREYKIARFQREKKVQEQLKFMMNKQKQAAGGTKNKIQRATLGSDNDDDNDDNKNNNDDDDEEAFEELDDGGFQDESEWREFELLQVRAAILDACALLESAAGELEMLEMIAARRQQLGGERALKQEIEREAKELRHAEAGARKNVTIMPGQLQQLTKREQLAKQVLQQGWTPATYTPQEAAELDMMEGKYLSGGQNDPENDDSEDEDLHQDDEEKLRKAREWDDFKDDNPRGAGNRSRNG